MPLRLMPSRSLVALLAVSNVALAGALLATVLSTRPARADAVGAQAVLAPSPALPRAKAVNGRGADPTDRLDPKEPYIAVY